MALYFFVGVVVFSVCFMFFVYFVFGELQRELKQVVEENETLGRFLLKYFSDSNSVSAVFSRIVKDYLQGENIPRSFFVFVCDGGSDYKVFMEIICIEKDRATSLQHVAKLVFLQSCLEKINQSLSLFENNDNDPKNCFPG